MNIFSKALFLTGLIFLLGSFSMVKLCHAEELMPVEKALKKIYKNATDFKHQNLVLTSDKISVIEQQSDLHFGAVHATEIIIFTVMQNNTVLGYALEDTVMGKWGPIHYLVGMDVHGKIIDTKILGFYEIRGRPVAKRRFLKQYRGKTIQDPVRLRDDIDGVSGATITSRSLTDGIRKILFIFETIKDEL